MGRPPSAVKTGPRTQAGTIPGWVWSCYYAVAAFFIVSGVGGIFGTVQATHMKFMGQEMGWSFWSYFALALDAVMIAVGLGLILKLDLARGVTNFICGLNIIFGLFGLAGALLGSLISGPLGILLSLKICVDIATNGFMIYLIGETDRGMKS